MSDSHAGKAAEAFQRSQVALLGIYVWEMVVTFDFEWDHITRKKKFTPALISYFANRYCALATMIVGLIFLSDVPETNCGVLYILLHTLGKVTVALSGINLSIRTVAIWARNAVIVVLLSVMCIVQLALVIYHGTSVTARRLPNGVCAGVNSNYHLLIGVWAYILFFNTVVLGLNFYKLRRGSAVFAPKQTNAGFQPPNITQVVFRQGLIFFIFSFLLCLIEIIFLGLDINYIMQATISIVAEVFLAIVSCRAVRSLYNLPLDGGIGSQHSRSTSDYFRRFAQSSSTDRPPIPIRVIPTNGATGWPVETELKRYPTDRNPHYVTYSSRKTKEDVERGAIDLSP